MSLSEGRDCPLSPNTPDFDPSTGMLTYTQGNPSKSQDFNSEMSIYPNPLIDGELNIKGLASGEPYVLSLFDQSGREVWTEGLRSKGAIVATSIPSSVGGGIYILSVTGAQDQQNFTLVLQ